MAAQSVGKLCLFVNYVEKCLVGGVALIHKVYLFGDPAGVNETGDWRRRGGVISIWGQVSTLEES